MTISSDTAAFLSSGKANNSTIISYGGLSPEESIISMKTNNALSSSYIQFFWDYKELMMQRFDKMTLNQQKSCILKVM